MRIQVVQPTASLVGDAGLSIGTWADLRLDPPPPYEVGLDFDSDAGCAHFTMDSARGDAGCNTVARNVDCDAGPLEATAGCPVRFTDGGVSFLVPDVGAVSGTLEVNGWPRANLRECEGLATCWLNNAAGIGGAVAPYVVIPTEIVP
jgi:hypothetical protein